VGYAGRCTVWTITRSKLTLLIQQLEKIGVDNPPPLEEA
jgi:hypothetical protein